MTKPSLPSSEIKSLKKHKYSIIKIISDYINFSVLFLGPLFGGLEVALRSREKTMALGTAQIINEKGF